MKTIQYTNGDVTMIPIKTGLGLYVKKEKVLELKLKEAQSLMICFLDFAHDMRPTVLPATKGLKKGKTGKHKKQ
jgi:hypothetical protein